MSRRTFVALRHRNFRLLWIGLFVSMTGSLMQNAAILWHVSLLAAPGRKALALGMVGLVRVAPVIVFSMISGVVINEVLSSSTAPMIDAFELLNITSNAIDIGGWYLTDDPGAPWKYRIADGTIINPFEHVVFDEMDFNPTPGVGNSFSLSSLGDEVVWVTH